MTAPRTRLADRRRAVIFELEVGGLYYTCTVGRFPDGSVGEVFLQSRKPGSQSDFNARDSAIVCSLALQHGVALRAIKRALLRDSRGNASTPLGAALDRIAEVES
jgi:ribonucleoside-diphosphate reductase alpha chain